jgi:hypothetical protein
MSHAGLILLVVVSGVEGTCGGDGGSLAVSAGAPASAAVRGVVSNCGHPLKRAEVLIRVLQDQGQSRPVNSRIGPVTTDQNGRYLAELSPPFAVPGSAGIELLLPTSEELIAGGTISFSLGVPPRDTFRLDGDVGLQRGSCGS